MSAFMNKCSRDVVQVQVPMDSISFSTHDPLTVQVIPPTADSSLVIDLQAEIVRLKSKLAGMGVRQSRVVDTLILSPNATAPDRIRIECDDLNPTISFKYEPAPRIVAVPVPSHGIDLYAEGGVDYDLAVLNPYIAVGLMLPMARNVDILMRGIVQARTTTMGVALQPILNAGVRITL
jgi:hypothetical protein